MSRTVQPTTSAGAGQRAQQDGLLVLLARQIAQVMGLLVPGKSASVQPWIDATVQVIDQYAQAAALLAADAYDSERAAVKAAGAYRARLADGPTDAQIEGMLRWAQHDLWAPTTPGEPAVAPGDALAQVRERTDAAASRLVRDAARATTVRAVSYDPQAVGWYRAPGDASPCAFCALMISRGAVYKTRGTAGAAANARFQGAGQFKFHDNCRCVALPVYVGDTFALSDDARRWEDLYNQTARGRSNPLRRFRHAYRTA